MKLFSHWTDDNDGALERTFFARKAQQETHSRQAIGAGKKVLAMGEYTINTADGLAAFLNKSCHVTSHDLAMEYAAENLNTPTMESMLS